MFIGSENRRRHAFLDKAVGKAHEAFTSDPHIRRRLGKFAAYYAEICNRLFVPNVRHGRVSLPAKYLETDRLPIIAQAPEETLALGLEFARFYPRQRLSVQHKLQAWNSQLPPDMMTNAIETAVIEQWQRAALPVIKPYPADSKLGGHVVAPGISLAFKAGTFKNAGSNPNKTVRSRPTLIMPYRKPPVLPSVATFAHEFTHMDQAETDVLFHTVSQENPKTKKQHYREELEAYHVGACAAMASLDAGLDWEDLPERDRSQLQVETMRLNIVAQMKRRDGFEPTGTLINKMLEIGVDFTG